MLASVAGEVAIVAVDHGQAGAHATGKVEGRESGTERESREGVPEIVDPPQRPEASGFLGGPPLVGAEVVDVEVAPALAGKQERRAVAVLHPIECVERPRLKRDRSRARFGLRDLQLAPRERAAHVDDPLLTVDVASLERDPLRRPQPGCGREQDHRPIPRSDRRGERFQLRPRLERMLLLPTPHWVVDADLGRVDVDHPPRHRAVKHLP